VPGVPLTGPLNCVCDLLDRHVEEGHGKAPALIGLDGTWSYDELDQRVCRIANVLVNDFAVVPGNRVLLRGANSPELAALWLAVEKVGAIAVTTMALYRAAELGVILEIARPSLAVSEARIAGELEQAVKATQTGCAMATFADGDLEARMDRQPPTFTTCATSADDIAMIAFTSGTTGKPKATAHFHRDILAMAETVGRHIVVTRRDDIFIGTPPLAFTFGLGGLLVFPLYAGAASVLCQHKSPNELLDRIAAHRASVCFTVPTFYQRMGRLAKAGDTKSLRLAVSSGESLPLQVRHDWKRVTGIDLTELLGSTEMLHAFVASTGSEIREGAIGRAIPGYEVAILDDKGVPAPAGTVGRLAVKGPTGCRYLDDPRQGDYVTNGWNVTGDACAMDADGYVSFHSRLDDLIVSSGYNISAQEVENTLLTFAGVAECAVVGLPDEERGQIVTAYVVPAETPGDEAGFIDQIQDHVRDTIAPYKYPRRVEIVSALPRNESGKIQRFRLRR